jgi:formylglycine-generating enzyme required for sulfatase activity
LSDVGLVWKYGSNGIADDDYVSIKVFAIEMVYVPQGSFYVGDGQNQVNRFTQANSTSGNTVPFQITATSPTLQGNDASASSSNLSTRGGVEFDLTGTNTATLASGFPTGYEAFYCMKYEVSQGQYRDFLNMLTRQQQDSCLFTDGNVGTYAGGTFYRFDGSVNNSGTYFSSINNASVPGERNGVRIISDPGNGLPRVFACDLNKSGTLPTGVNQTDDGEWIAMGLLSWMYVCSYLDWVGLRPMTELEFEKACRGDQVPVSREMPWGQTAAASSTYLSTGLRNSGTTSETGLDPDANHNIFNNIPGSTRVGAFADGSSNRAEAGASYYGIMNFADNVWEPCVSTGCVAGRSYSAKHGNGSLLNDGRADVDFWPGINGNANVSTANTSFASTTGITKAAGACYRGGIWPFAEDLSEISCRNHGENNTTTVATYIGVRGVRSKP